MRGGGRHLRYQAPAAACPPPPSLQARALKRAQDVRKQLIAIMDRYKLDLVSAGAPATKGAACGAYE